MSLINVEKMQISLWRKYLPLLLRHSADKGTPHDYYSVFFKDAENNRYILKAAHTAENGQDGVLSLSSLYQTGDVTKKLADIPEMDAEIVHYKKNYTQHYKSIFLFALDRTLKVITLKTQIARLKGRVVSGAKSDTETISRDRFNLLRLLVASYVNQRPSRTSSGFSQDEVIALLYGTLWYKHIKNEAFRRKIKLLLESLVISGDLTESQGVYYVQGQAITTLVEYEKEDRRVSQQQKMHKNIVRFMFVITVATLLIILVLLGMAGIVDLSAIWQKILQIKPVRFMLKFI
ncbi:hypothetical protein MXM41_02650 [Leclercia adecarboxylata]|uniref:hypothetical protein n=1 Tax=Leclercia adecarboxylata TaxID=83655 RepID=UPI002DBD81D1|nr:hypothetical protein [Leclercia adecarboxylata]MEB6377845.1 hypothetical protein [Leclercia adecarboxylata]